MEPVFRPPAQVAEMLAAGEIDVGLIPSIELQRIPDLQVVPGLAVAARHEVRSVLLVSRRPLGEVRSVALDLNSRTSAALVRILLEDAYGVSAEYRQAEPDLDAMLAQSDAALIIGDPALHIDRDPYRIFDLAHEWRKLTGHPFVFAVWAVRRGVERPGLAKLLRESLRLGLENVADLATQASGEMGLSTEVVHEYLTENLSFQLGAAEMAGLEEYFRRAQAHGLIERVAPLQLWSD